MMSGNGFRVALRTIGYINEQIIPHGFMAQQLAHVENNSVRGAYNHAEYMTERIKLMQWWADYLDELE